LDVDGFDFENLKTFYAELNKDGAKNLQVILVSGDRDQAGFDATTKDMPWLSLPFGANADAIKAKVPCTGYPTPGIINGKTGAVIDPDAFGKVSLQTLQEHIASVGA